MRAPGFIGHCLAGMLCLAGFQPAQADAADGPPPDSNAEAATPASHPLSRLPYIPSLDLKAMDPSANACVDFYQYACGGWLAGNPIPADQASWSVYGKLYRDNQQFLWGILADLGRPAAARSAIQQKIGDYFASCMDESAIERQGAAPLEPLLAQIAGLETRSGLPALLAALQIATGSSRFLFGLDANQDFADSSQVIAFVSAGGLGLPDRDYYTDDDARAAALRQAYREHVARTFGLLGEGPAAAAHDAATVMRIETRLARASLTRVERRDPYKLYHKLDMAGLARLTPQFAWTPYLQALNLEAGTGVNVTEPHFFQALDRVLSDFSVTDLKTYLRWQAAHWAAPYLAGAFERERFDFFEHRLRGVPVQQARWKRCVTHVDQQLGDALGQEFVARTFGPELKAATLKMTRQIEDAMRQDIGQLTWMSAATQRQALAKLDSIINKIGYPDRWRDYGSVEIRAQDFFGNALRATAFGSRRQLAKIGKPLDRTEWAMTPQTVNAYYDPQMNDINFPAGVLQPPLYDPAMDDAPNYGDTGGTIGHELTHGFDDEGRKFDAQGNLKDWWDAADTREFEARTNCIVDQYAEYVVVDEVHINSRLTLGEDVADLGGLILAHMAWVAQTAGQSAAPRDGLSPEQRFFVGYAQWACENNRPDNLRLQAKLDPHSPGRYRVNGLVANMPEFQRAFSCPVNAPMVNKTRCRVW
jgi:endothelin-converting enzyme/putative endopeptidase